MITTVMNSVLVFLISAALLGSPPLTTYSAAESGRTDLSPALRNSIREVKITDGKRLVALTFDLCEGPRERAGFDVQLVDFLEINRVEATFFAGGKWMQSHPEETMRLMAEPLFEIGNHSWSHANFRHLDMDQARQQVVLAEEQYGKIRNALAERLKGDHAPGDIMETVPGSPVLFRFPYGACTPESLALLAEYGIPAIQWSIVSGDPAPNQTARNIIRTVLVQIKPGAIVVFHANGKGHGTLEALQSLVPELRARGYEFATVSRLLASGEPVSTKECYETRPGDTARYEYLPLKRKVRTHLAP